MSQPALPLPESYWVVPGHLLAGEYPGSSNEVQARRRLTALLNAGFDTFIDLTRPGELEAYQPLLTEEARLAGLPVSHQRFAIGDFGLPGRAQMTQILNTLDLALATGHKVYLHCWGGIGRTGTTVGCYLVRHGQSGREALMQLAEWWRQVPKSARYPHSPETTEQVNFILNWNELA
jgi:hypothetical protein